MNYTWQITQMKRNPSNGCVLAVEYDIIGTDGEYTAKTSCGTLLEVPESDDLLIPFENLTEELVLEWIQERLGEGSIANLKQEIINEIELQKNPEELTGLPWQSI
jgi:hypothetical protein